MIALIGAGAEGTDPLRRTWGPARASVGGLARAHRRGLGGGGVEELAGGGDARTVGAARSEKVQSLISPKLFVPSEAATSEPSRSTAPMNQPTVQLLTAHERIVRRPYDVMAPPLTAA